MWPGATCVDANDAEVPIPKGADGKLDQKAVQQWQKDSNLAKVGNKFPCWAFFHSQGCSRGDKCKFHHQE